ncbi:MAG TPA: ATPase, partial [Ramlibacter sp.]|nr:ATPase [Ramlibacter sp.]
MAVRQLPIFGAHDVRRWLFTLAYLAGFVGLDWASYIRPLHGLNITPWNPQPALAIVLLMWRPRKLWLVWVGLVAAELLVRGVPSDPLGALAATIALTATYAALARAMAARVGTTAPFRTRRNLFWFAVIVTAGSLVSAFVYVLAVGSGLAAPAGAGMDGAGAVARYWIGDAVGMIVATPVLLGAADTARRAALVATLRSPEWWATAAM